MMGSSVVQMMRISRQNAPHLYIPGTVGSRELSAQPEVDRGFDVEEGFKMATTAAAMLLTSPSDNKILEGGTVDAPETGGS